MHLHLDPVGGLAGDMFVGALLHCFPDWYEDMASQLELAGFSNMVKLRSEPWNDGTLTGVRFKVNKSTNAEHHDHRHYSDIVQRIETSGLDTATIKVCLGIFEIIARAEAQIHDKPIEKIAFHEVGAWDSIADIVCASYLISRAGVTSCSYGSLPLGGGQVRTAHGMLPVPAPATALILKGFNFHDDGIAGERVTPTGAAILAYLGGKPVNQLNQTRTDKKLRCQGFGFGTKIFPGLSNVVRALIYDLQESSNQEVLPTAQKNAESSGIQPDFTAETEMIETLEFELDDQTPEQLATAISHLRNTAGVIDVVEYPVVGKKNRLCQAVRILCEQAHLGQVLAACFDLTSTLGVRQTTTERHFLPRQLVQLSHEGQSYQVKIANRPGGDTAKAEQDELGQTPSLREQNHTRKAVETLAIKSFADNAQSSKAPSNKALASKNKE